MSDSGRFLTTASRPGRSVVSEMAERAPIRVSYWMRGCASPVVWMKADPNRADRFRLTSCEPRSTVFRSATRRTAGLVRQRGCPGSGRQPL